MYKNIIIIKLYINISVIDGVGGTDSLVLTIMATRPYSVEDVLGMIEDLDNDVNELIFEGSDDEVSDIDTDTDKWINKYNSIV